MCCIDQLNSPSTHVSGQLIATSHFSLFETIEYFISAIFNNCRQSSDTSQLHRSSGRSMPTKSRHCGDALKPQFAHSNCLRFRGRAKPFSAELAWFTNDNAAIRETRIVKNHREIKQFGRGRKSRRRRRHHARRNFCGFPRFVVLSLRRYDLIFEFKFLIYKSKNEKSAML